MISGSILTSSDGFKLIKPYRKTGRGEGIPGFGQAPDFCVPDEVSPAIVIEAKITSDDGTARDKVARIKELETQRNHHVDEGRPHYEVVACIDGRGFRERREDMRQMLLRLGKSNRAERNPSSFNALPILR